MAPNVCCSESSTAFSLISADTRIINVLFLTYSSAFIIWISLNLSRVSFLFISKRERDEIYRVSCVSIISLYFPWIKYSSQMDESSNLESVMFVS